MAKEYIEREVVLEICEEAREEGFGDIRGVMHRVRMLNAADVVEVKRGDWEKVDGSSGWGQHRCSRCKKEAFYEYDYDEDWDEDYDGEHVYLGRTITGIIEELTDYCPHCGCRMDGGNDG